MNDFFYLEPGKSIREGSNWYRNIQFIGKGGNGVTFLIVCTGGKYKGGLFALKVFYKISSEQRRQRFSEEILFMKEQHHPSIMRQYGEGAFADRPFVIMEYIPNTLTNEIQRKSISIAKGLTYSLQLLSAVKHLHSLNKIHRDIKPGNVFINNSSAVLGDFGLLKDVDSEENEEEKNEILGYIAMPKFYRTPELVRYARHESNLRKESDIFQLGLLFACIFTGKNPLKPTNNLLSDIELDEVDTPKGRHGRRIKNVIDKMLIINPDERITVDEVLDNFNGIFQDFSSSKIILDGRLFE